MRCEKDGSAQHSAAGVRRTVQADTERAHVSVPVDREQAAGIPANAADILTEAHTTVTSERSAGNKARARRPEPPAADTA